MEQGKAMKKVTKINQIQQGDKLLIDTCYGTFKAIAKKVIFKGTDREEILIHKGKNHYFILSMLFDGSSWVDEAFIANNYHFKGVKSYRKGNVKNL